MTTATRSTELLCARVVALLGLYTTTVGTFFVIDNLHTILSWFATVQRGVRCDWFGFKFERIVCINARLIDHDRIVQVAPLLHVRVQLRFSHETRTARHTLERLFVTVHVPVRIPIIGTVERFMAHLACVRFHPGVNAFVFLEVLRIDEGSRAQIALVRPFTGVS